MNKYIFTISLFILIILLSCEESPLGIEDNIRETLLTDTTKEEPPEKIDTITRFKADSIILEFQEYYFIERYPDTSYADWISFVPKADAEIDTAGGQLALWFNLTAQGEYREDEQDTTPVYWENHISAIDLNLDSIVIEEKIIFNENTENFYSKIWAADPKHPEDIITYSGEYPVDFRFTGIEQGSNTIFIHGSFTILTPSEQSNEYGRLGLKTNFTMIFNLIN